MDAAPLRVIIAEDSALIREGVARLIAESGETVVAKVGDGPSFVEAVVAHRPDVSIVDVRMPPSQRDEGLRAAIEARRRVPGTPVLILSQYVERQYATFGSPFKSLVIANVALNAVIGPVLFKIALERAGETKVPAPSLADADEGAATSGP